MKRSHLRRAWRVSITMMALGCCGLIAGASAGELRKERFREADEPLVSERVIEQSEWASELVFALGLWDALPENHEQQDLFGLLCAEEREEAIGWGGLRAPVAAPFHITHKAPPGSSPGEPLRLIVSVPATALYALTVNGVGAQRWAVDQKPLGHLNASALGVAQAPKVVPLRAGPHELTAYLTHGARVDRVELTAHRPLCIAPSVGWRSSRALTFSSSARTLVHALGLERRLPMVGQAISIEGEGYQQATAWGGQTNRNLSTPASGGAWAIAVDSPAEFTYRSRLAEPGVYSLMARVHGGGNEIWSVDARYRVTVRPHEGGAGFGWVHVMTRHLDAGPHVIRALLPRDAGIDSLHWIRRRATGPDYIRVLEEAGFASGVPGQRVTQTAAYRQLGNPLFAEIAGRFLNRLAGDSPPEPSWVLQAEIAHATAPASTPEF